MAGVICKWLSDFWISGLACDTAGLTVWYASGSQMGMVLLPAGHTGNMLGALEALTGQRPEMLDVLQCSRPFRPIMNFPMACAALKCFAEEVSENSLYFSEPVT